MSTVLTTRDGRSVPGYEAKPASKPRGAVVLLQEWWGVNAQIKGVADRLAAEGYRVFVPDLFRGRVAQSADEANHLMSGLDFKGACHGDIQAALDALSADGLRCGVMGFCMGGALTVLSAATLAGVDGAVCYYGVPPEDAADLSKIRAPMLGHFATRDYWCNAAAVARLEAGLTASGAAHAIYWYEADHAFFNEKRKEVYVAEHAALSWARTLAFFAEHVGRG